MSDLVNALKYASAAEISAALMELETTWGREGIRFEVTRELFWSEPHITHDGPDPLAFHDQFDLGFVTISLPESPRVPAMVHVPFVRAQLGLGTIAAAQWIKNLASNPHEFEVWGARAKAEALQKEWQDVGFTATIQGFGESRAAKSHTYHIRKFLTGPAVA